MTWKEITEKAERYKAEGKSEQEVAELLRDDIGVFVKDFTIIMEEWRNSCQQFSTLLFEIIGNGGLGR